jgi:hypothetical protein
MRCDGSARCVKSSPDVDSLLKREDQHIKREEMALAADIRQRKVRGQQAKKRALMDEDPRV